MNAPSVQHCPSFATQMGAELAEAPEVLLRQACGLAAPLTELVTRLREKPPTVVVTCARGSSAHAAYFAKHMIERHLEIPVAAASPSIATVYGRELRLKDQLLLAISQSGASDDLVEQARSAKRSGAIAAALVNDTESPLAKVCDIVLPMGAGPERSIAATKTFIASLAALVTLTAMWADDQALQRALLGLPERLKAAAALDWSPGAKVLANAQNVIVIGRGPTLAIAREAALKLKEVCHLHAEAFSGAEFLHGPVTLVSSNYPILMFMPGDAAAHALRSLSADLRNKGASVLSTGTDGELPSLAPDRTETDAICLIHSFYAMALRVATMRGLDADKPRHLQKVTRTR